MLSEKPWRVEAVIQLLAGLFVCLFLGAASATVLRQAGVAAFQSPDNFGGVVVATLSFQGAAWILIFIFLRIHSLEWREAFGFRHGNLKRVLMLSVGLMALVMPVVFSLQYISVRALDRLGWPPEDQRVVTLLVNAESLWMRGYLVFFAVVLTPVAEEFIFRGVLFPFIKQLGWPKLACLGVSGLFALIHFNAPTFLPLFVFALAMTWLYEKTDCLLAPIVAHGLFNGVNLVLLVLADEFRLPVQP